MRAWMLVVVGAVLPLVLGASLGSLSTDAGEGTWAYPMPATAFLLLSLGLVASHLLVVPAYLAAASASVGSGVTMARVGAVGSVLLAGCELWSGLVARTDLDAPVLDALNAGYGLSTVLVAVGTIGTGALLRRSGSPLGLPLLVNGVVLVVAAAAKFAGPDALGIAALTVWSLIYVWVALAMRKAAVDRTAEPVAA